MATLSEEERCAAWDAYMDAYHVYQRAVYANGRAWENTPEARAAVRELGRLAGIAVPPSIRYIGN